jgi:hypothetical protein
MILKFFATLPIEMLSDDFCAGWQFLDVWGIKLRSEPMPGQASISVSTT